MKRLLSLCRDISRDQSGIAALEFAIVGSTLVTLILGTVEVSNAIRIQAKLQVATGQLAEFVAGQLSVVAGQSTTAPGSTLTDLCNGAAMNLAPYPAGALSADIVSLTNDHPSNRETTQISGCSPLWPSWLLCPFPPTTVRSTDTTSVHTYRDWENLVSCATPVPSTLALGLGGAFDKANNTSSNTTSPNSVSLLTKSGTPATNSNDTVNLKYGYSAIVVQAQYNYANVLTFFLGQTINFSAVAIARPRSNTTIQCTTTGGMAC